MVNKQQKNPQVLTLESKGSCPLSHPSSPVFQSWHMFFTPVAFTQGTKMRMQNIGMLEARFVVALQPSLPL